MRTMARAIRKAEGGGEPLPSAFPSLARAKVLFRRSEFVMVAGQPGEGKSAFALALALRTGVPTLYVSADSSIHTQMTRVLAALTGKDQDEVEGWIHLYPDWCEEQLRRASHITWCFDSAPTLEDVEEEMDAFITMYGEAPGLLIIDNMMDVTVGDFDEWAGLRALAKDLKFWARAYDTCVLGLHHVREDVAVKSEPCPPRHAIHGKVSQIAAMILTLASQPDGGSMWIAPVKNRSGYADKSGRTAIQFVFDPASMLFNDPLEGRK